MNKLIALSDDRFQEMLENGSINPGMKRKDAVRKAGSKKSIREVSMPPQNATSNGIGRSEQGAILA